MQQGKWRRWLMMTVVGFITLGGALIGSPQSNSTNEPDFSNVKDIVGPQRHLLRNDDLVVSFGSGEIIRNTVLRTTHSSISREGTSYGPMSGSTIRRAGIGTRPP